ncbi:MAG: sugar ABC transporter permease [Caldilineaceae bacterium]
MINDKLVTQALKVTTIYAVASVPLHIIFGLGLALLLNAKIVGLRFYRTAFYLPSVLSGVAVALLWRWLFSGEFGLFNALLSYVGVKGPSWLGDPNWALPSLIGMSLWGSAPGRLSTWPVFKASPPISTKPPKSMAPPAGGAFRTSPCP